MSRIKTLSNLRLLLHRAFIGTENNRWASSISSAQSSRFNTGKMSTREKQSTRFSKTTKSSWLKLPCHSYTCVRLKMLVQLYAVLGEGESLRICVLNIKYKTLKKINKPHCSSHAKQPNWKNAKKKKTQK